MMKLAIALVILMIVLGGCAGNATGDVVAEEPFKIGVVNAMTGSASDYGIPAWHGMHIALQEINDAGGINGRRLELIVEDGKCEPKQATAAAQKLISVDQVAALITGCSTETMSLVSVTRAAEIVQMATVSSSPAVSGAGEHVFRTSPSDLVGLDMFAERMVNEMKYRRVSILSELKDYPQGLRKGFEDAYVKYGGTISLSEGFIESEDYRTHLLKAAKSEPEGIVLFAQTTKAAAQLLLDKERLGIDIPLLGNEMFGGENVVAIVGDAAEGVLLVTQADLNMERERTRLFSELYESEYPDDQPPNFLYVATSYDAVHLLADAMRACGEDSACIQQFLDDLENWPGASGDVTFDEHGDPEFDYVLKVIKDGEATVLE